MTLSIVKNDVMSDQPTTYGRAILSGFEYLLENHADVFVMGQGLWSPWYVGSSMTDLEKKFGTQRVIDTPISELSCTGMAIGASLCGYKPIIVHPRMDFMVLAADQIVNQAAKWHHMLGGQSSPSVTIRAIINRGGEQGAQHSQALHAWYAHIPGLRVVMPYTVQDARDLLVAATLCSDPVLYIDDRWLYEQTDILPPLEEIPLHGILPRILRPGDDITLVGSSYSVLLCLEAAQVLVGMNISCEVIDLRVINPLDFTCIASSVRKTGRLCVVDGGWRTCGLAGEIIAGVMERVDPTLMKGMPVRITLPDAPAPTSKPLEMIYYTTKDDVVQKVVSLFDGGYRS